MDLIAVVVVQGVFNFETSSGPTYLPLIGPRALVWIKIYIDRPNCLSLAPGPPPPLLTSPFP